MNSPKAFVLDATVAVKWYLKDEPFAAIASDIQLGGIANRFELHVPGIFRYEVSGALKKACATRKPGVQKTRISIDEATRSLQEFYSMPVHVYDGDILEAVEALEMAIRYSKGHYDMLYLRLAQKLNCELITADAKIVEGVPAGFPRSNICLLADWQP